jgi:phosphoglycerate dehydrogenase-like enzyme
MYAGDYLQARVEGVQLRRVSGRVLGLVGFGASGKAVARRAKAFGMRVLATRRNVNRQEADALGVEMVDLETLLRQSDFVSLHLPLTPESYHLLDDAALGKMKPGAFLINTSRGALVDEHALAARLRDGRLAGAGLDTFEGIEIFTEQEAPPVHPLAELDNVILTPHVSGLSVEALEDVAKTAVENLVSVLSGRYPPPENIVNRGVVSPFSLAPYDPSLFEG